MKTAMVLDYISHVFSLVSRSFNLGNMLMSGFPSVVRRNVLHLMFDPVPMHGLC